ncbi:MAG: inositol monophosphatase family protein [Anaerolineae bacterium]
MIDLKPILAAARQAADLTRRVQQLHLNSSDKGTGSDPVTIADYGSQAILLRAIGLAYPDDGVLAEETGAQFLSLVDTAQRAAIVQLVGDVLGEKITEAQLIAWLDWGRDRDAARTWLIDPVDGTKGFVAGRRYSIAISPLENGMPLAGVLASPGYPTADGRGLLFYAQRGTAYVEEMRGGAAHRIAVSTRSKPAQFKIVESVERSHAHLELMHHVYEKIGVPLANVESVDSQDKYAMIAAGDADLSLRLPREANPSHKVWDHAAGSALVRAAGGVVTDVDGSALDFTRGSVLGNRGMIVSSGVMHDQIIEIVQAALG